MPVRARLFSRFTIVILLVAAAIFGSHGLPSRAVAQGQASSPPIEKGQRVFSAGHSFHVFVPGILVDMAKKAGIKDHEQAGLSAIGGSRVHQHWDVADEKNKAKEALRTGKVDVLTLSPIHLPDTGIENFARLALEHNPRIRILVQENWLPFDMYDTTFTLRPEKVDHNAPTGEELRKLHATYFKLIDEHVEELNKKLNTTALLVAPVGQAVIALREKIIAGEAPGLKVQQELFGDPIGHATAPLQALVAYCYFAQIYQRSPVGLPLPAVLENAKNPNWDAKLNALLQELAWNAVTQHPLSGVKAPAVAQSGLTPPDSAFPAHRIVGNVYYVGSKGLASYLIATPEGHILINSGFEETVPLIRAAVESLGYKMRDIKILLESHAHSDHVAGHALAQELTNARVHVMQGDDKVIASGGERQYLYTDSRWRPCTVDVVLKDGDEVKLGGETLYARRTPGHTRGCTTWTWRTTDGDKKYNVVVIGSPNVNPGYRLVENKDYPEIADDFDKTFKVLKALPCDVFLGAHGDYYGMLAKFDRIKSADQSPFIDPAGYQEYVAFKEKAFRKTLADQMAKNGK